MEPYMRAFVISAIICVVSAAWLWTLDGVSILPHGEIRFEDISLRTLVFEPGYKGTYQDASSVTAAAGYPKNESTSFELKAAVKLRSSGKTLVLIQNAKRHGNGYHMTYLFENPDAAEFATDHTLVVNMPIASSKGRTLVFDDKKAVLPAEFGGKYALEPRTVSRIVIPLARGSVILTGKLAVHIQDMRVFKGDSFELKINYNTRGSGLSYMLYAVSEGAPLPNTDMPPPFIIATVPVRSPYAMKSVPAVSIASVSEARQHARVDIRLSLSAAFENPFDPDEIDVRAKFTAPSGKTTVLPAFFHQPYTAEEKPDGSPSFALRFLPTEAGRHTVSVRMRDASGSAESAAFAFTVSPGISKGFVRAAANKKYFRFDDGTSYFPVGHNVCWSKSAADYVNYFSKMSAAGENYSRIWIGPFTIFTLERIPAGDADYAGLTRFDLRNASRFDAVLANAEEKGIFLMYCIESFNSFLSAGGQSMWHKCPYNVEFGGPCAKAGTFFTDADAKKAFKKRLRYIVARYAYAQNIMCWQLFNEVQQTDNYSSSENAAWHAEMAGYLKSIDPYMHLVSTSTGNTEGDEALDSLPGMDFTVSHNYGAGDAAVLIQSYSLEKPVRYGKPHFFGEFGADVRGNADTLDTEAINLHNGIYASAFSLGAGTGMLWWWDNYIEPQNLYRIFTPLAQFVKDIPFAHMDMKPALVSLLAGSAPTLDAVMLEGKYGEWKEHPANRPITAFVSKDGLVTGADDLARVMHGIRNHAKLNNPVTFTVDYLKDGKFSAVIAGVSDYGGAKLVIVLDGKKVLEKDLIDDNESRTGTMRQYSGAYTIDIPQGKHTVTVDNQGNDWMEISYRFDMPSFKPPLHIFALADTGAKGLCAMAWFKHKVNTYALRVAAKAPLETIQGASFVIQGLSDASYRIEWWDTYKGGVQSSATAVSRGGSLTAAIPPVEKDIACKIYKQ
ncbi:MAG: DUF5060 domain-containing protein [Spirochaetota bacterium]